MKTLDQKLGWIMVILCAVFFYLTSELSAEAALYPRFVLAMMVLLTLFFLVQSYRIPGKSKKLFTGLEKNSSLRFLLEAFCMFTSFKSLDIFLQHFCILQV